MFAHRCALRQQTSPPAPAIHVLVIVLGQCIAALCLPATTSLADESAVEAPPRPNVWRSDVQPFLQQYCYDCHSGQDAEADIDFEAYDSPDQLANQRPRWEQVRGMIAIGAMPPDDYSPLPAMEERQKVARWIGRTINDVDCGGQPDPGRVTMRRLNNVEYDNALRDLLGIDDSPSTQVGFPSDGVGNGFDNQGEVLSLSPLQLEKYLQAAKLVSSQLIIDDPETQSAQQHDLPHHRLFTAYPTPDKSLEQAAEEIFRPLLRRAFRRDIEEIEVQRVVNLVKLATEQGESYQQAIGFGLQSILVSPHFLFRVEVDDHPQVAQSESPQPNSQPQPEALDDFALASRLSFFLWASIPDDELLDLASQGKLAEPGTLQTQTTRMLADPRSSALVERFFAQYLGLGNLKVADPDRERFPLWNDRLREAMRRETELFLQELVREDRSLRELLDADFTYVNPRMAELYGIDFDGRSPKELYREGPGIDGDRRDDRSEDRTGLYLDEERWLRVTLPAGRQGVLTQAAVLTLTSNPTSTSPVKRGKWILESLLGDPPPPAPPNVPALEATQKEHENLSLRQALELHRVNPSCASCHKVMDPLGLGFENFDAIGQWRERDGEHAIDPAGQLPDGRKFSNAIELVELLQSRQPEIMRHFAQKLLTYALGRGLEPYDNCAIDTIISAAEAGDYRLSSFVQAIATSEPFNYRRSTNRAAASLTAPAPQSALVTLSN